MINRRCHQKSFIFYLFRFSTIKKIRISSRFFNNCRTILTLWNQRLSFGFCVYTKNLLKFSGNTCLIEMRLLTPWNVSVAMGRSQTVKCLSDELISIRQVFHNTSWLLFSQVYVKREMMVCFFWYKVLQHSGKL